jgi:SAM-dependent methyltransferase
MRRRSCPLPGTRRPPWHRRWRTNATAKVSRYLSGQAAHPHGILGRLIARIWIRETAAVNDIAIDLLAARPGERVAEIGCGSGRTLGRLATASAQVLGVDISSDMVGLATQRNAAHIAAGRLRVVQGDGTALPVDPNDLDGVISVHSLYFWPDPPAVLAELHRAVRPGGRLVLAFRAGEHPLPGVHPAGPDLTHEQARQLGVAVGRLHRELNESGSPTGLPAVTAAPTAPVVSPADAIAEAQRFQAAASAAGGPFDTAVIDLLDERIALIDRYATARPTDDHPHGPHGWTHGDLQYLHLARGGVGNGGVGDVSGVTCAGHDLLFVLRSGRAALVRRHPHVGLTGDVAWSSSC